MKIEPLIDQSPFARSPLTHLAQSLVAPLSERDGTLSIAWNTFRPTVAHTYAHFLAAGSPPVLCMETPLFGRHLWQFDGSESPEHTYYRLALHDPSVLYGGFRRTSNLFRLESIFERLGLRIKPWRERTSKGHIILALQVPGDTSLKGINILESAIWTLQELRRYTRRPIVVSIHPDCFKESWAKSRLGPRDLHALQYACRLSGAYILREDESTESYFTGAHCCVTYTSGTSFEALLAGIPCITLHRGSFQYPITEHDFENIEHPMRARRRDYWAQLAHIQYSWAEIERGDHLETVNHLLDHQ